MPDLAIFQQLFLDDIYHGSNMSTAWLKETSGNISPDQSLKVYHHSSMGILEDALLSAFPVVTRLVGEDFMRVMLAQFVKEHPLQAGNLNTYGHSLGHFIGTFRPAATLPYLSDVAMLEWAMHYATFAPDASRMDASLLAGLDENVVPHVKLIPHPSLNLVKSEYPIEHIWLANQPEASPQDTVNLGEGGTCLAIWRPDLDVFRWRMNPVTFTLLQYLVSGAPFAVAMQLSLENETASLETLQTDIAAMLANGLFTGIQINQKGDL